MIEDIVEGDIIQITDVDHAWLSVLLIVDEVKPWGVIAYAIAPKSNDGTEPPGLFYNRLEWGLFEQVGVATIVQSEVEGE